MIIQIQNHGSLVLAQPLDDEARRWIADTMPEDAQMWSGALVLEPRYVANFLNIFMDAGGEVV